MDQNKRHLKKDDNVSENAVVKIKSRLFGGSAFHLKIKDLAKFNSSCRMVCGRPG